MIGHRGGAAAIEFGLVAPIMVTMLIMLVDLGFGFYQYMQVTAAVSAGAEFATLAGQYGTSPTTIATEVKTVVVNAANSIVPSADVTVTVNNGNSASYSCCVTASTPGSPSWNCASTPPTCSDQSNPGVYLTITGSVPITPIIVTSVLTGAKLKSSIIQRVK